MPVIAPSFRFSGHETFVCRYAWLPKTIRVVMATPKVFSDDDQAMVELGVGKNMVTSIRFWAESAQIIEKTSDGEYRVTDFGESLLGPNGFDSFLEDPRTLWLLHWKIATNPRQPIFYWHQLLNFWHRADFSESEILPFFIKNSGLSRRSTKTAEQGFRVFVNTYVATRGRKGDVAEENLDSPLIELDLVRRIGERFGTDTALRESIFSFNLEDKPAATPELFAYCLDDFWKSYHPEEATLPFRTITVAPGSPGQIFKLPEVVVRRNLDLLKQVTDGAYTFEESASIQQVIRNGSARSTSLLKAIYVR